MAHFHNNALIGAAGAGGAEAYQIDRSLRFNSGDSAYLSRTPSSEGNRKKWTWSGWVKRSELGRVQNIFRVVGALSDTTVFQIRFMANDAIGVVNYSYFPLISNAVFRDVSAWLHLVVALDVDQASNSNKLRFYINGSEITSWATDNRGSLGTNAQGANQASVQHEIGGQGSSEYFSGYLAEIHFVDGQALAPTDFGEYDDNNVWQPKKYAGAYDQKSGGRAIANSSGALPILNTSGDDGEAATSGVRTDSNASSIVLALPLNGSNGGTTITDYHHTVKGSGSAKAISIYTGSASGGAVTSTAVSKYYGSSFYAVRGATNNYSASDYIHRTGDSDLDLGTGSFCVEFWYYPTAYTANSVIFDNRHQSNSWPNSSNGFSIVVTGNGSIFTYSGGNQIINHSTKLTLNEWNHIAYTRDGSTERLFVNGDFFSTTASSSRNYNEGRFHLGSAANNGEGSDGYYQDLRIYKGVAKYTSNFTVPVAGAGGVNSFYLKFADNSSNAALGTDSSGLSNTWTVNNIAAQASTYASAGTHSGKAGISFNGTNAEITLTSDSDVNPGSGVFTLECYAYAASGGNAELGIYDGSPGGNGSFVLRRVGAGTLMVERHNTAFDITGAAFSEDTWHHVAVTRDSSNNVRLFVDGNQSGSTSNNTHNYQGTFRLGRTNNAFTNGYISNLRLIKGTCLYTSNFTAPTGNLTNVTNTKLLMAQSTTSATAATVKPSGVTISGSGDSSIIDSLIDTPTNYTAESGNNGGNYCTLNPLDRQSTNGTLSNGNLDLTQSSAAWAMYRGTMFVSSGKWYYEINIGNNQYTAFGILSDDYHMASATNNWPTQTGLGDTYVLYPYTGKKLDGTQSINYTSANTSAAGDIYGVAFDLDNGTITFYKNGASLGQAFTGISGNFAPAAWLYNQSNADSYNFGQRPFAYTPPSGHKSLCTQNLDDPTIAQGAEAFEVKLWSGNNADPRSITTSFGPDLVWIKTRNQTNWHYLTDTVRGAPNKLYTNSTNAEDTAPIYGQIDSLNSDGFTLGGGTDSSNPLSDSNQSGTNYVAWAWDAGSSNSSITAGSSNSAVYNESYDISPNTTSTITFGSNQALDKMFNGNTGDKMEPASSGSLDFTSVSGLQNFSGTLQFAVTAYNPNSSLKFVINASTDSLLLRQIHFHHLVASLPLY